MNQLLRKTIVLPIRTYFQSSLRRRLWLLLFGTVLIILLIMSAITSRVMSSYLGKRVLSSSENLVYQGGENLEYYFSKIEKASLIPYTNSTLYSLMASSNSLLYPLDSYVKLALNAIASVDPSIIQVHIYSDNVSQDYLLRDSEISNGHTEHVVTAESLTLEPLHMSHTYGITTMKSTTDSQPVITLHRTLRQVPEDTFMGYIDIDIDTSYLSSALEKLKNDESESIYLLNNTGEIIYTSSTQEQSKHLSWIHTIPSTSNNGVIMPSSDLRTSQIGIYQRISLESGELLLAKTIPTHTLTASASTLIRLNWLTAVICLMAASVFISKISTHFTAPIQDLAIHMEHIGQGDMTGRITSERTDEIGTLFTYFQSMMDNINQLIRQKYLLELSNKNNQLYALQAQLNPHFINNTIQSIGTFALKAGNTELYEQLSNFGSMMHYCMDFKKTMVSLNEELSHVDNYLAFQKIRFNGNFVYSINNTPDLLMIQVPKMLLQPIVENCFKHGRVQERKNGFILVIAEHTHEDLVLTVLDNGNGAPESDLKILRQRIEQTDDVNLSDVSEHIGILNIASRIRLHYGDKARLEFRNRLRGGFEVTVIIPQKEAMQ